MYVDSQLFLNAIQELSSILELINTHSYGFKKAPKMEEVKVDADG